MLHSIKSSETQPSEQPNSYASSITIAQLNSYDHLTRENGGSQYKKAVLPLGNRAMPQVFFSVEVRQQHSLQV